MIPGGPQIGNEPEMALELATPVEPINDENDGCPVPLKFSQPNKYPILGDGSLQHPFMLLGIVFFNFSVYHMIKRAKLV